MTHPAAAQAHDAAALSYGERKGTRMMAVMTTEAVQIRYYSGYIRNYRKLCSELELPLDMPRAQREEAILKAAYARWGADMALHLHGAFAFVLHDERDGRTYCCRDHVGQKALFYAVADGELLCSGDIDAIVRDPRMTKRLNLRMLQLYLFYGYPIGAETFYEGVFKLPPGHYAVRDGGEVRLVRYFAPTFEPDHSKTADQWAVEIRDVVTEILDEERGDTALPYKESFLSGGVDSSYLLAAGDAQCANTVGYAEADFDESVLARRTAEILHKGFRVKEITPEAYFARIPAVIDGLGQPLGDASAVAFSIGCEAVREHAQVVYSGEGIDEFFGGYNAHRRVLPSDWTYLTCSHIMSEDVVRELMRDYSDAVHAVDPVAPLWAQVQGQDPLSQKLYIDISLWLEGDIYLNTDRTSTACGVELHTPFSDRRLFDVARRIPADMKFREEQNKYVFRKAASSLLPDEVAFRKKVGFAVPVRKWLADSRYNGAVRDALFSDISVRFFREEAVRSLWERFTGGEEALWSRVYTLYAFLLWYELKF